MFLTRLCKRNFIFVYRTWTNRNLVQRSFSQISSSQFNQESAPSIVSNEENTEWLWSYLRERKSFIELTEEQRRRVIEIGEFVEDISH